jgi:hypothetical protein
MPLNLISRVQTSVNAQKSSFCSRSTRLTVIGDTINTNDVVTYVNCEGNISDATYREIFTNNGYINDCVQGGCPIISRGSEGSRPNRYFVQFGTTDCEVFPPTNLSFSPCNGGSDVIVRSTGYNFMIGSTYNMTFTENPQGCFTLNDFTSTTTNDTIRSVSGLVRDCAACRRGI